MKLSSHLQRILLSTSLALFGGLMAVGAVSTLIAEYRHPVVRIEYVRGINHLLEEGELRRALDQMVLASELSPAERLVREEILPQMARLGRRLEDRPASLEALRRLVVLNPSDARWRVELSEAILEAPSLTLDEVKEAGRHAQVVVDLLDPGSGRALLCEVVVAAAVGQPETAQRIFARALVVDATLAWPARVPEVTGIGRATAP